MPYGIFLPATTSNLESLVSTIPNGSDVYFYKDATGNLKANNTEHPLNISNFGYPFQFIDGSVSYTTVPIQYLFQIPWEFSSTSLQNYSYNLWDNSLMIWIDAQEPKSISNSLQKIVSKDYPNNLIIVENTTNFSFSYASPNLSLTNNSSLESSIVQIVQPYFKLGMVFTLGTQTLNSVLFQHNRLKIKLTSQTAADGSTQSMIGIFDNDVFKRGITLKASDLSFKYFLYTDNIGNLTISSNASTLTGNPSYYQATSAKIYIGSDSTKTYPSNMTLHELLYYESDYNGIPATFVDISNYFTGRHSLSTYYDLTNIAPANWTHQLSKGNRTSLITFSSNATRLGPGPFSYFYNGSYDQQGFYHSGSCVGQYHKYDLTSGYTIVGFKLFLSGLTNLEVGGIGYFNFEGSNNDSTWDVLTTGFIWGDITSPNGTNLEAQTYDFDVNESCSSLSIQTRLFSNSTAYRYYRFIGTSGVWNASPYYHEICFKIATIPYSWTNTYSKGDRSSIITITSGMDYSPAGSAPSCIINGIFSGGGVTTADRLNYSPTNSAPYYIRFQMAVAQKIMAFKISMICPDTVPLLADWQGSTDATTWVTLSPSSFDIFTNKTVILGNAIIPDTGSQIMSVGNGQVYTHTFNPPSIDYLYYRILFNTNPASTLGAGYITEINFKTSA